VNVQFNGNHQNTSVRVNSLLFLYKKKKDAIYKLSNETQVFSLYLFLMFFLSSFFRGYGIGL